MTVENVEELLPVDEGEVILETEDLGNLVINERAQGKKTDGEYVFGTDEIRKEIKTEVKVGDKAYIADEHGTTLVREKYDGKKDHKLENKEYYDQGYIGQQKDDFGDEGTKKYEIERGRDLDFMGRQLAADYEHIKIAKPDIGPRKQLVDKKKKNKDKIIESMGSVKYPERLATREGTLLSTRKSASEPDLCPLQSPSNHGCGGEDRSNVVRIACSSRFYSAFLSSPYP